MWYRASSVISAVAQCKTLFLSRDAVSPNCPKTNRSNPHCSNAFPKCEGKNYSCEQSLKLETQEGHPVNLYFEYFIRDKASQPIKDGRIKKTNSTLRHVIDKYDVKEEFMSDV